MKPTYDEKQIGAVLTYCLVCHRHFYFTGPPRTVCLRCEQGRTHPARVQSEDESLTCGSATERKGL